MHSVKKYLESFYYPTYIYGKLRSYAQPYLSTQFAINEIVPNLYLGDFASAANRETLREQGFTHIITAILGVDEMYPDDFKYLILPLRDVRSEDIFSVFPDSYTFIREALNEGGKVLVHCMAGASRSATIVAAYLVKEFGLTAEQSIDFLQNKRNVVKPNSGFKQQLQNYDAVVHGKKQRRQSI